jgi:hypothetical protein
VTRSTSVPMAEVPGRTRTGRWRRGRTGARFRDLSRPVSPARPPHRTSASPRVRRSPGSRSGGGRDRHDARPWCRDIGRPPSVSSDLDLHGVEHDDPILCRAVAWPAGQKTPVEVLPGDPGVPFTQPCRDPPPDVGVQVGLAVYGCARTQRTASRAGTGAHEPSGPRPRVVTGPSGGALHRRSAGTCASGGVTDGSSAGTVRGNTSAAAPALAARRMARAIG